MDRHNLRTHLHVMGYGVTLTEVETLLLTATRFACNKRNRAGDYVAVG